MAQCGDGSLVNSFCTGIYSNYTCCDWGSAGSTTGYHCTIVPCGYYIKNCNTAVTSSLCPAGQYTPSCSIISISSSQYNNWNPSGVCSPCPPGKFSSSDASACTICFPGQYQAGAGTTGCTICPAGQYQTGQGATSCIACPAGQYSPILGTSTSSCMSCSLGYWSISGRSSCDYCEPSSCGTNSPNPYYITQFDGGRCGCCPAGSYTDGINPTCYVCSAGKYVPTFGLFVSSCLSCPAGSYTTGSSFATSCLKCSAGQYQSLGGASGCIICPAGQFQDIPGQTSCMSCSAGQSRTSNCKTTCPAGQYQPQQSAFSCTNCPSGMIVRCNDEVASFSLSYLLVGYYQLFAGQSTCIPCPAGQYQINAGQTECTLCMPGQYLSSAGQALTVFGNATENFNVTLTCPSGSRINSIIDASYGTSTLTSAGIELSSSCNSLSSKTVLNFRCIKQPKLPSCVIPAENSYFGDPCSTIQKNLIVIASCTCTLCLPGQYQKQNGASAGCNLISAGCMGTSNLYGDTSNCPITCEAGTFSLQGASSCTVCPSGYTSDVGASNCSLAIAVSSQPISSSSSTSPTVVVTAIVVPVALCALLVFCFIRRQQSREDESNTEIIDTDIVPEIDWTCLSAVRDCPLLGTGSYGCVLKGVMSKRTSGEMTLWASPQSQSSNSSDSYNCDPENRQGLVAIKVLISNKVGKQNEGEQQEKAAIDEARVVLNAHRKITYNDCITKVYGIARGIMPSDICRMLWLPEGMQGVGIVMRFESGGSLESLLHKRINAVAISLVEKLRLLKDIARGLAELHHAGIIHADLKPGNVLLSGSTPPQIRLADFGLSFMREDFYLLDETIQEGTTHTVGTPSYCAPELLYNPYVAANICKPSRSTDVYAFAIMAWEILSETVPYKDLENLHLNTILTNIQKGYRPQMTSVPTKCPKEVIDMIECCWEQDQNKRKSASDCYKILNYSYRIVSQSKYDVYISYDSSNQTNLMVFNLILDQLTRQGLTVCYNEYQHNDLEAQMNGNSYINASRTFVVIVSAEYAKNAARIEELKEIKSIDPIRLIVPVLINNVDNSWCDPTLKYLLQLLNTKTKKYDIPDVSRDELWVTEDTLDEHVRSSLNDIVDDLVVYLKGSLGSVSPPSEEKKH